MDVYLPTRRHSLYTDTAVTILVGRSAYMTMVMVVVLHRRFESSKSWRTIASSLACRKHGWDRELRKKYNQQKRKHEFLEHFGLLWRFVAHILQMRAVLHISYTAYIK